MPFFPFPVIINRNSGNLLVETHQCQWMCVMVSDGCFGVFPRGRVRVPVRRARVWRRAVQRGERAHREQRHRVRPARGWRPRQQEPRRTAVATTVLNKRTESLGEAQTEALRFGLEVGQTQESPDRVHVRAAGGSGEQVQVDAIPVRVRAPEPGAVPEPDGDAGQNMVSEPPDQVEEAEPGRRHQRADRRERSRAERVPESPEPVPSHERAPVHALRLPGPRARRTRVHGAVAVPAGSRGSVALHAGLADLRRAHVLHAALIRAEWREEDKEHLYILSHTCKDTREVCDGMGGELFFNLCCTVANPELSLRAND